MVFNSYEFAIFFAILFIFYWLFHKNNNIRNIFLLLGSIYFYATFPGMGVSDGHNFDDSINFHQIINLPLHISLNGIDNILILDKTFHYLFVMYLLVLITFSYIMGILINVSKSNSAKQILKTIGCAFLIFGLLYLRYSGLILGDIPGLQQWQASAFHLLAPVGISFYSFSCIGYLVDLANDRIPIERNYLSYATYISFFPHLLIGPIPTASTILPQFSKKPTLTLKNADQAIGEILWGLFKKMVVADNINNMVKYCFDQYADLNGSTLVLGVALFGLYLHADFSGYSDIVKGLARLLGIEIINNFDKPFYSKSITEFWRRWHISMSSWFNTHIFNPIVIKFRNWSNFAVFLGLFLTFAFAGIWHGANWKYLVFGVLHGLAVIIEHFTKKKRKKMYSKVPVFINTSISKFYVLIFLLFTWTFFRANNSTDAINILARICSPKLFETPLQLLLKTFVWCLPLVIIEFIQKKGTYTLDMQQWGITNKFSNTNNDEIYINTINISIKVVLYLLVSISIYLFCKKMNLAEYYYFKF